MLNEQQRAQLDQYLDFMKDLNAAERQLVVDNATFTFLRAGDVLQAGGEECRGLTLVLSGQLRAFYMSENGKEITLYRLLSGDVCIMTMSCMMRNITFGISIEAEKPSGIITIPTNVYNRLSEANMSVKQFSFTLMEQRFSDVFWVLEQFVFKGMGERLAIYLLDQAALNGSNTLPVTHEAIARDLGSAREVISRLLKHFETDGLISQKRGRIHIENEKGLRKLAL